MIRITQRNVVLIAAAVSLAAACSANSGNVFDTNSTATGTGATGHGGSAGTGNSGNSGNGAGDVGGGINITTSSGTSSGSSGQTCNHAPDQDGDGDGWTANEGDCNDCDPNVNPGAVDVLVMGDGGTMMVDTDCSGTFDPPTSCDDNLALTDTDPKNGARAVDLCKFTVENPADKHQKTWGVIDAQYVRADGSPYQPSVQVGIQDNFGPNVHPQGGKKLLALSSGTARIPGQPGACGMNSCYNEGPGTAPPGYPQNSGSCTPDNGINDDVALQLRIRTPTNATGYSFAINFYSFEYPEWVCTPFNDQFISLVSPAPMGSNNGNISFDSNHNPVSVNVAFFNVCSGCPLGTNDLVGNGFDGSWGDDAGATGWLKSQAPVKGGDIITIRWAIWDTSDQAWDSTALVDNFQWIANGGSVTVSTDPISTPK
jgi:hypothetical protein